MLIKVSQTHIDNGRMFSGEYCPIALAIKDLIPRTFISVGYLSIRIGSKIIGIRSRDITSQIINFDLGYGMNPLEFECPDI